MTGMKKTADLTRGEILVGIEQGVYKDGDKFGGSNVGLLAVNDETLVYENGLAVPLRCSKVRYYLIEEATD